MSLQVKWKDAKKAAGQERQEGRESIQRAVEDLAVTPTCPSSIAYVRPRSLGQEWGGGIYFPLLRFPSRGPST